MVQMHLVVPSSVTWPGLWFAEVSPLLILVAARWIHLLRWYTTCHCDRLDFFLALQGLLTSVFQPSSVVVNFLH